MKFNLPAGKKMIASFLMIIASATVIAQEAKPAIKEELSSTNLLVVLLIGAAIVLALVIWGMGRALIVVGKLVLEKNKQSKQAVMSIAILVVASLLAQTASAEDAVVKVLPNYGGISEHLFDVFAIVIGVEVVAILFLAFSIKRLYAELLPEKETAPAKQRWLAAWWSRMDKKLLTRAVPVAKEADVMLDHDYDGIRELDNSLPPWWKYGFYITIVVAIIYLFNFHVSGNGKTPEQEYLAEVESAKAAKAAFEALNKDKIDEEHVPMADAAGLEAAKAMFLANCVSCHGDKGQGGAGPNLTDDYWLHKGSLNDVYQSIKHGYPDKGMQPWIQKFNPKEVSLLASYVKSIRGTNPAGAIPPQGDLFTETVTATDSVMVKKDSIIKKQ